jgi:epoxyqueuosine reductase
MTGPDSIDLYAAKRELVAQARALGFGALGVARIDIPEDERHLVSWLAAGFEGEMHYMRRPTPRRSRPQELFPATVRVISARMDYWPAGARAAGEVLADTRIGYVSRYALGRDYHKVLRRSLAHLAADLQRRIGSFGYRVCVDSAPVLEKAHAQIGRAHV